MRCFISRRAPQIESFSESRESLKRWGYESPPKATSTPMEEVGFELFECCFNARGQWESGTQTSSDLKVGTQATIRYCGI